jgi:hypothetical protein
MNRTFLESLGLIVTEPEGGGEATLELEIEPSRAFNPLTRGMIDKVGFSLLEDRLVYLSPPEFVGAQPISLAHLESSKRLEDLVIQQLNDQLFQIERRSRELASLGVSPKVDPATLQLSADLASGPLAFTIASNRAGQFRVTRAEKSGRALPVRGEAPTFELSEFRERGALCDFLAAMFREVADFAAPPPAQGDGDAFAPPEVRIPFKELLVCFGDGSLPPRSGLELQCDLRVRGVGVRFAAARVQGRTFRGLLAGPSGKLWAGRFDLDGFPGIRALVAQVLKVSSDEVEVLAP